MWKPGYISVFPVYEKIGELGVPIIFHSGILFFPGDGSRFCRPVFFEALLDFPSVRFALAHIGWPWVDECLAVYGRFRSAASLSGEPMQMWIDTTPGTPPAWRVDALRKAFAYAGDEHILWGSDASGGTLGTHAAETLAGDRRILSAQLGLSDETQRRWMRENAIEFLGL